MSDLNREQILKDAYALIAELWCSPLEEDGALIEIRQQTEDVIGRLEGIDRESALSLSRFHGENTLAEEEYVDLFELDPRCPLYLGSHTYDEPQTCATAAVSDRNEYMIELGGIYSHFGRKPNGKELPDYLPLMVDFLSLTVESRDDPVRDKFMREYILPFLPPIRTRLEELRTPYLHLLDALEKILDVELETQPLPSRREQQVEHHVG
jgi:nitrate reductase delta subunit